MTSNIRSGDALRDFASVRSSSTGSTRSSCSALDREQLADIVELQLARLRERLAERGLSLELTDDAKENNFSKPGGIRPTAPA